MARERVERWGRGEAHCAALRNAGAAWFPQRYQLVTAGSDSDGKSIVSVKQVG